MGYGTLYLYLPEEDMSTHFNIAYNTTYATISKTLIQNSLKVADNAKLSDTVHNYVDRDTYSRIYPI